MGAPGRPKLTLQPISSQTIFSKFSCASLHQAEALCDSTTCVLFFSSLVYELVSKNIQLVKASFNKKQEFFLKA